MILWWILAAIICAFVIGYIMFAPSRKVAPDEHIEPAGMRSNQDGSDRMKDSDRDHHAHRDPNDRHRHVA